MILFHPLLINPITIEENKINVVVIENRLELRKFLVEIIYQISGNSGDFTLSNNNEIIDLSKMADIITDPINVSFNSKKISNVIFQLSLNEAINYPDECNKLISTLNLFANRINTMIGYDICFTDITTINDVIKLFDFQINDNYDTLSDKIINYITIQRDLLNKNLVFLYNLKALITESELISFYKAVQYNKLNVILLEDYQRAPTLSCEKYTIIDKDLCVF